jgi:hypothetical protein
MSKINQESFKQITIFVAMVLAVLGISTVFPLLQQITAQNQLENNMTGNQTGNQSAGLNLLPPRIIEEEVQEEILGEQQ